MITKIIEEEIEDMIDQMYEDQYTVKYIIENVFKSFKVKISKSKVYRILRKRSYNVSAED